MEVLKIGGVYKTKEGWLLVNKKVGHRYLVYDIMLDEEDSDYDMDIGEMTEKEIREIADTSVCYVGKFRGPHLYAVWDGQDKKTIQYVGRLKKYYD